MVRTDDLKKSGKREYVSTGGTRANKNYCRVSIRNSKHLIVTLTKEIAAQAKIKIDDDVGLYIDDKSLTLVPGGDNIRVRDAGTVSPYLLIPFGAEKLFDCTIKGPSPARCDHAVDKEGRLILTMPPTVVIKFNDVKQAKAA